MNHLLDPTPEELAAVLERTDLPTLVTEGRTDYSVFRNLQKQLRVGKCLPAGGKRKVLAIRDIHGCDPTGRARYLVDQDLWSITSVPEDIQNCPVTFCTDGYSIENDGLRDANVESLIYDNELEQYNHGLDRLCEWHSAISILKLNGEDIKFERKISEVLLPGQAVFTDEALAILDRSAPPQDLIDRIRNDYPRLLRGKTWAGLLSRTLDRDGRDCRHSINSLLELGIRQPNGFSANLCNNVAGSLGP